MDIWCIQVSPPQGLSSRSVPLSIASSDEELSRVDTLSNADRERIIAAVDAAFDVQIDFLSDLIRCASLRGQEAEVQNLVEAALRGRGYEVERQPLDPSLIGRHPAFSP